MIGHGANRGKVLEKMVGLFGSMPDKEDKKDGGIDEAAENRHPAGDPAQGGASPLDAKFGNVHPTNGGNAHVAVGVSPHQASKFQGPAGGPSNGPPVQHALQGKAPTGSVGNFAHAQAPVHIDPKGASFFDPLNNKKGNRR